METKKVNIIVNQRLINRLSEIKLVDLIPCIFTKDSNKLSSNYAAMDVLTKSVFIFYFDSNVDKINNLDIYIQLINDKKYVMLLKSIIKMFSLTIKIARLKNKIAINIFSRLYYDINIYYHDDDNVLIDMNF